MGRGWAAVVDSRYADTHAAAKFDALTDAMPTTLAESCDAAFWIAPEAVPSGPQHFADDRSLFDVLL